MKLLETILVQDGICHHLDYHQERLERSFFELFQSQAPYQLNKLLTSPVDKQTYRCRFIYDKNSFSVEYLPYKPSYKTDYKLIPIDFDYGHKFLDRKNIDKARSSLESHIEAIFIKDGLLTDTTIANLACFINGSWLTPKHPLLLGTTRARLINEKKLKVADISLEDFKKASKLAFFNALTGFYEVKIS